MQKITIFFLCAFFTSFNTHAFSVSHDLFVTVGAFDASKVKLTYALTPQTYQINSQVSTNGFFNTAYPFQASYTTSGKIINDQLVTKNYGYTSKSRFNTRSKEVIYNTKGRPVSQITSKNGKLKKKDFTLPQKNADTFDLQTVLVKTAYQYNSLGFCDSQISVYDGKRQFDVVIKDEGQEILPPSPYFFHSPTAAKCSLRIDKLLSEDDDTLWEFSVNKPIYFWIIRDEKTRHPVIARIQIKDTPLGELNAYTTEFKIEE